MQKALTDAKYSHLTGRFEDIGEIIVGFIEGIIRFIARILSVEFAGFGDGVNTDVVSVVFIVIAIFVLGICLAFIARMVLKYKRFKRLEVSGIFEDYRNNRLSFDEIMAQAEKNDKEANFKEAVRYRYLGLIMLFNSKEIVRVTDSMTGVQFEREAVKNMPASQKGVRELINMYYSLFFGHKSVGDDAYKNHIKLYNALIKGAQSYDKN